MTRDEALKEIKDSQAEDRPANLTRADLTCADLTCANLTCANLSKASLIDADLRCANLRGANLTCANLHGAILTGAILTDAILTGADLTGTCLDPNAELSGASDKWLKATTRSGVVWVCGYRTLRSTHVGNQVYTPGYYEAPVFSTAPTECHPGLYLFRTIKRARDWANGEPVIEVITLASEIHEAGGKSRCKWFIAGNEVTT